jgi:hypothetical protein
MDNIFADEIKKYEISTDWRQQLAATELLQKTILAGLSETDFFEKTSFHGGTALRMLHNLDRFSLDLDFSLIKKDGKFKLNNYMLMVQESSKKYGCLFETYDNSKRERPIIIAEIRDLSIPRMANFKWADMKKHSKKIFTRIEVDSDPPEGSKNEEKETDFPSRSKIRSDTLPTLFAGKCHALLCRDYGDYIKGRDWYDFLWYVDKKVMPNYEYLSSGLNRNGKWKDQQIKVDRAWLENALKEKIQTLDMEKVKIDVMNLISDKKTDIVNLWDNQTLLDAVDTFHKNSIERNRQRSDESDYV